MNRFALFFLCVAVLLSACGGPAVYAAERARADEHRPNVVLITIDTLRADHLSCYGYARRTSPFMDSIAQTGIRFQHTIAPSSWTSPSMVSLFTSVYPLSHGVVHGFTRNGTIFNQEIFSQRLSTLAEILKAGGYRTFGVAANPHLGAQFGFARGFDFFDCLPFTPAPEVNATVLAWQEQIRQRTPFFLWVHYSDPHWTYAAREPWIKAYDPDYADMPDWIYVCPLLKVQAALKVRRGTPVLDKLAALYDSEINYVDHHLEKLMTRLGLLENTLLVLTSDHGEGFCEHGTLDHGKDLHAESINVPLIIRPPGGTPGTVVGQDASLLDVMPTVLALLGVPRTGQMQGLALLSRQGTPKRLPDRVLFSELQRGKKDMRAIVTGPWKYIYDAGKNPAGQQVMELLFNQHKDPSEQENLAPGDPVRRNRLRARLLQWSAGAPGYASRKVTAPLSDNLKEKLKTLGYIEDSD